MSGDALAKLALMPRGMLLRMESGAWACWWDANAMGWDARGDTPAAAIERCWAKCSASAVAALEEFEDRHAVAR